MVPWAAELICLLPTTRKGSSWLSIPLTILLTMQSHPFPCAGSGTWNTFVGSKTSIPFLSLCGLPFWWIRDNLRRSKELMHSNPLGAGALPHFGGGEMSDQLTVSWICTLRRTEASNLLEAKCQSREGRHESYFSSHIQSNLKVKVEAKTWTVLALL